MVANEGLKDLLKQLEGFISTKTVIGEPIELGDTVLLPVVDVSLGIAVGGKDKRVEKNGVAAAAGGTGAKLSPSAILVIKGNDVRLVNIKNQDTVTKVMDMVPDVLERLRNGMNGEIENKRARDAVDDAYKAQ